MDSEQQFGFDDVQKCATTNTNADTVNDNTGIYATRKRKLPDTAGTTIAYVSTTDTNSEAEDFQAAYNACVDQQPGRTRFTKQKRVAFEASSDAAPHDSPIPGEIGSYASTVALQVPRRGMASNRIKQKRSSDGYNRFEVQGRWDVKVDVSTSRPKLWFSPTAL